MPADPEAFQRAVCRVQDQVSLEDKLAVAVAVAVVVAAVVVTTVLKRCWYSGAAVGGAPQSML